MRFSWKDTFSANIEPPRDVEVFDPASYPKLEKIGKMDDFPKKKTGSFTEFLEIFHVPGRISGYRLRKFQGQIVLKRGGTDRPSKQPRKHRAGGRGSPI